MMNFKKISAKPPYYAVIFTSTLKSDNPEYHHMAAKMVALAGNQPGYLGEESARQDLGITISYWQDLDSIKQWKANLDHREAQEKGQSEWYAGYQIKICRVERAYDFLAI